jgi:hypothetical protein
MRRIILATMTAVMMGLGISAGSIAAPVVSPQRHVDGGYTVRVQHADYYWNHHRYYHRDWDRHHHRWHYYD